MAELSFTQIKISNRKHIIFIYDLQNYVTEIRVQVSDMGVDPIFRFLVLKYLGFMNMD